MNLLAVRPPRINGQINKLSMLAAGLSVTLLTLAVWQSPGTPRPHPLPELSGPSQPKFFNGGFGGFVVADDEAVTNTPYSDQRQSNQAIGQPPAKPSSTKTTVASVQRQATATAETYVTIDNRTYPLRVYEPLLAPNDPSANQTWVTNATVNQMWDIPAGGQQTVIAVIDTGFGLEHEEFTNRWHRNSGETGNTTTEAASRLNCTDRDLPPSNACNLIDDNGDGVVDDTDGDEFGATDYQNPSRLNCSDQAKPLDKSCNQIDDDANGYIDDVTGWDFANNDNSVQAGELNPTGSGTTHGTRVAGIAAATGNNGKGIAGVDWYAKILPIQALSDDSYGDTRGVGRAILYAARQGADVISLSLGSDLPDDYVREAIQAATAAGSVVVAASGNDGCACMVYPANYPEVVAVGALTNSNQPASFNSYGNNLDILAPGTQMTTASWSTANPTNAYASNVQGTSFAAPLVSGLLSRMKSQRPQASPLQLIAALHENTNRTNLASTVARSPTFGYGLTDAFQSLNRMVTGRTSDQLVGLAAVSKGAGLLPGTLFETGASAAQANYNIYPCTDGRPGATPLYELIKSPARLFSISQTEVWQAQRRGYQTGLFAEVCVQQPHDTATSVRALNIPPEFRNVFDKP